MADAPETRDLDEAGETELRALYENKALAEIAAADAIAAGSDVVAWRGSLTPAVAVIKGLPGPAEAVGGSAVSGADGEAVAKALERLGHDPEQVFYALSRPDPAIDADAREARIRTIVEAVDAPLVVALDREAATDLARGYGIDALALGRVTPMAGRRFVACEGLEAALPDERAKRRVWAQLSAAEPSPPVF